MFEAEKLMDKLSTHFELAFTNMIKQSKANSNGDIINLNTSQFKPVFLNAMNEAGNSEETAKKFKVTLDLDRQTALNELKNITDNFSYDINSQNDKVVKEILMNDQSLGISYKDTTEKIADNIGLNEYQARQLNVIEEQLKKDFLPRNKIKEIIKFKSEQMIRQRAKTIALTESARAVSSGRYLIQKQLVDDGLVHKQTLQEWLTGSDERSCAECSQMDEIKVPVGEYFTTGRGLKVRSPIIHPRCRCIVILDI